MAKTKSESDAPRHLTKRANIQPRGFRQKGSFGLSNTGLVTTQIDVDECGEHRSRISKLNYTKEEV